VLTADAWADAAAVALPPAADAAAEAAQPVRQTPLKDAALSNNKRNWAFRKLFRDDQG